MRPARFDPGAMVLAAGVFAGLALPPAASALRPALPACVAGLLMVSLVRVDWSHLLAHLSRPFLLLVLGAWLLGAVPLLVHGVVGTAGLAPGLALPLVLAAASPPIVSGPAIALLVGLDAALLLAVTVGATLAAPFTLSAIAIALPSLGLEVDPWVLFARAAALVGGCLGGALALRRGLGPERLARLAPTLDRASMALLLVFAVAVMDGVTARLLQRPAEVLLFLAAAFALSLGLQLIGGLAFGFIGRRAAITVAFASGNRNLALLLAVLPAGSPPDTLLYFAVAQVPIYVLPALLGPLYRRLAGRHTSR